MASTVVDSPIGRLGLRDRSHDVALLVAGSIELFDQLVGDLFALEEARGERSDDLDLAFVVEPRAAAGPDQDTGSAN